MKRFTSLLAVGVFSLNAAFSQTVHPAPAAAATTALYPVALGQTACANNLTVTIGQSKVHPHIYDITFGKAYYFAERIPTESGAVKLEDKHHGIVWLQMSNKSMLFNEKLAKRLATDCQNEAQKAMDASATAVATLKP